MVTLPDHIETRLFIDGEFITPSDPADTFPIATPFSSIHVASVHRARASDVDAAVSAAAAAFPSWSSLPHPSRKSHILKLASLLRVSADELALLECLELGRTRASTLGEVAFVADIIDYYAHAARDVKGKTMLPDGGMLGMEIKQPYGVVGAIYGWNVPISMFGSKAVPALAVGNTVVVKCSERAPLSTIKLAELCKRAGFPPGVVNVLAGYGKDCGEALALHPGVGRLSFTGSTATGRRLMEAAAKSNLKTLSCEMGGKSPCLIFGDGDVELAAQKAAFSIGWLGGQTCFANSRILIQEDVLERFLGHFRTHFCGEQGAEPQLVADPTAADEDAHGLTPLVDRSQLERVLGYIADGAKDVAPLAGGRRISEKGFFVEPTIFVNLPTSSRLWREEIFGPVACVRSFRTEHGAIELANDVEYGLAASVFTKDLDRAIRVSKALEAGTVTVNTVGPDFAGGGSFGGWKTSGYGSREGWKTGLEAMVRTKAVSVRFSN